MSSETALADALIERLETVLRAALPTDWRIQDAEAKSDKALSTVVYYEQGDISNEVAQQHLNPGYVGVDFTLTVVAPESEPVKGTRTATSALLTLLPFLDAMPDLFWGPVASKIRLESGETAYRLPITFLSRTASEE